MRGTTGNTYEKLIDIKISIHVPREGDDRGFHGGATGGTISIHVPREGDDPKILPLTAWTT